jgi:radical SAM protein with 4Fe4S-binding SPASM domain
VELMIDHGVGPYRADGRFKCVAGRKVAYITGEGNLYPCPSLMAAPFLVGNVFETDLAELVASPALHWVRRIRRHELAEPCRSCENKKCSGGCRGAAYAATGDVYAAPAYCNFQRRKGASEPRREHRPRVHDSGSTAT